MKIRKFSVYVFKRDTFFSQKPLYTFSVWEKIILFSVLWELGVWVLFLVRIENEFCRSFTQLVLVSFQ